MTINFKQSLPGMSILLLPWMGAYALDIAAMVRSGVVAKGICSEIRVVGRDPGQDFDPAAFYSGIFGAVQVKYKSSSAEF